MSGAIRLEVMRKRRDAAAAQSAAAREQRAREDSRALQQESAERLDRAWEKFTSSIDELIRNAKGDAGQMGPMPDHEWNKERTKIRFQRQNDDGEIEWGPWSAELRSRTERQVIVTGGGSGGADEARVIELIQEYAMSADTTEYTPLPFRVTAIGPTVIYTPPPGKVVYIRSASALNDPDVADTAEIRIFLGSTEIHRGFAIASGRRFTGAAGEGISIELSNTSSVAGTIYIEERDAP